MSNILNDLTYSEDKINGQFKITNTPSKLKLRARTYEGLNKNISKRRSTSHDTFVIPEAFMPQNVYVQQPQVQMPYQVLDNSYTKTSDIKKAAEVASPKKLKTSREQINALLNLHVSVNNEPSGYNVTDAVPQTTGVEMNNYSVSSIENNSVNDNQIYANSSININYNNDAKLEDAREKVFAKNLEVSDNNVDKAIEADEFSKLDKITKEYNVINDEYNKSKKILEEKQQENENRKNELTKAENDLSTVSSKINDHKEVIDAAKKDISMIREEMREVTEKINHKIELIKVAKERRLKEKLSIEEEASKLMDEIKTSDNKLTEIKETIALKDQEKEQLAIEEDKLLKEKMEIQNEYDKKLEILKAMTLPAEIEDEE